MNVFIFCFGIYKFIFELVYYDKVNIMYFFLFNCLLKNKIKIFFYVNFINKCILFKELLYLYCFIKFVEIFLLCNY